MHDQINSRANTILWVLFAASALLFVIASSNVANLVLARTLRRESELAMRSALGASTAALRRSLLAESLVLCGSGVTAALLIAAPMVAILGRYAARFSVRADDLHLDFSLVWFGVGLALVASIFLAYIPRLPSTKASPAFAIDGRWNAQRHRLQSPPAHLRCHADHRLVPAAVGRGPAAADALRLESKRPPFDTSHVLAINLPPMSYGRTPQQQQDFNHEVVRRVSALPGVKSVATGFSVPWRDSQGLSISFAFAVHGATRKNGDEDLRARFRSVSPGFFSTLGMPILEGRDFRDGDKDGSDRVVIISKSVADGLFPGQEAMGRTMRWTDGVIKFIGIGYDQPPHYWRSARLRR